MPNYFRIFGAGEWGLALANHLTEQDNLVEIYIRNSKKYSELNDAKYCNNLKIKFNNKATFNLLSKKTIFDDSTENFEIYNIIATSSSGFVDIIEKHKDYFSKHDSLTWITKGIDHNSGLLFHKTIDNILSKKIDKCLLSGPSFARDLVDKNHITISIGSTNLNLANTLINAMQTEKFSLIYSNDLIGMEVSGVIKNIVAILAGIMTTNGYNNQEINKLIDMAKQEVHQISSYIQSTDDKSYLVSNNQALRTLESPACLGDMLLTCFNDISRNRQFGLKLGFKIQMQQLLKDIGTVEGFLSTKTLYENTDKYQCGNIVRAAYKILYQSESPIEVIKGLLN
jgi:glycerol-3-phosphate dehydrogenase (NAD(P)+)